MRTRRIGLLLAACAALPGCWVLSDRDLSDHDRLLVAGDDQTSATSDDAPTDTSGGPPTGTDTVPGTDRCAGVLAPVFQPAELTLSAPLEATPRFVVAGAFLGAGAAAGFAVGTDQGSILAFVPDDADGALAFALGGSTFSYGFVASDGVSRDVDGDGSLDVMAPAPAGMQALLGGGDGGFSALTVESERIPGSVDVGDLDGDGAPDAVVVTTDALDPYTGRVQVLAGLGEGRFGELQPIALTDGYGRLVRLVDLDGDGAPEVVVANVNGHVQVLRRVGPALADFAPAGLVELPDAQSPSGLAWGDFDFDGHTDVAVASETGGNVDILRGDGAGGLTAGQSVVVEDAPRGLVAIPVGGTGCFALATTQASAGRVVLLMGTGPGTFAGPVPLGDGGSSPPIGLDLGDLDADGDLDIVAARENASVFALTQETP